MRPRKLISWTLTLGLFLTLPWGGGLLAAPKDHGKGKGHKPDKEARTDQREPLRIPVAGIVETGGTFTGTLSLERFAARDDQVLAVGMVSGLVTGPTGAPAGTALVGPLELPVVVTPGIASGVLSEDGAVEQQQAECEVLHLDIGPVNLNVLGLTVTTLPIGIDLSAEAGGTNVLGTLICLILETVGNVLGLVDLLNALLGALGGLTG